MRFTLIILLLSTSTVQAEAVDTSFCDLVRLRAEGLLEARFKPGFDLADAKAHTHDEPMFEAMLRHAWAIKRPPYDQQDRQIQDFADYWYGQCILG